MIDFVAEFYKLTNRERREAISEGVVDLAEATFHVIDKDTYYDGKEIIDVLYCKEFDFYLQLEGYYTSYEGISEDVDAYRVYPKLSVSITYTKAEIENSFTLEYLTEQYNKLIQNE